MNPLPLRPSAPRLLILAALSLAPVSFATFSLPAQSSTPTQAPPATAPSLAPPPADHQLAEPPASKPNPDNAWLARTSKLYYSSSKAGLTGFDCDAHPDWQTLVTSATHSDPLPADDPRLTLFKSIKVSIHAHMKGGSTIDWTDANQVNPLDQHSIDTLDGLHRTVEQMLEGFLQFWTPFIESSIVPDSANGLDITHTPTVHTIHAHEGDTELTEVFSPDLILEQFNVNMNGTSIKFAPTYKPTPKGLLVSGFRAHVVPAGTSADQAQDMDVDVDYQTINGFPIPDKLNMDVIGTGKFNFTFDGCATSTK
jgi:hypothetical protein